MPRHNGAPSGRAGATVTSRSGHLFERPVLPWRRWWLPGKGPTTDEDTTSARRNHRADLTPHIATSVEANTQTPRSAILNTNRKGRSLFGHQEALAQGPTSAMHAFDTDFPVNTCPGQLRH